MKDLTKGYPAKVILFFAIPLIFGSILQQFYNLTDSKIVSAFISPESLGAVGATAVVSNTLIGFLNGLTQGFAILIARSFGEKNMKMLKRYVAGMIKLTLGVAIVLTIVSQIFIKDFLILLKTPADLLEDSTDYVRIILMGICFIAVYNMCANALRAVGDSIKPLIFLIISIVINLVLDLLFVCVFKMGIKGAAYATIISQALSAGVSVIFILFKYKEIVPDADSFKISRAQYSNLITVGLSMGLMGCIVNIGTIILQSAINKLGTEFVTAHIAGRRVFDIMMILIFTIGTSMTTYVSQNLGAGKYSRIRQGIRHAFIIDFIFAGFMILFAYTIGGSIVAWVASTEDKTIVENGIKYIQLGSWFFMVLGPLFILRCSLQGLGHKIIPLVSSFLEMTVKIISAFVVVPAFKYIGVIMTEPISWIIMIIPLIIAYLICIKRELS